jgi:cell division protein FtsL
MPPQASQIVERIPFPKEISTPSVPGLLRFEKAICFSIIIFALMILSSVSHRALTAKIESRDLRIAIQRTESDIGRLREDLQQAQSELTTFDAPEGMGTLPIEPGDVASVTLSGLR